MKKIIVITLLLTPALLASAAMLGTPHTKLPLLEDSVTRAIAKQQVAPAWKAQLKQMQQMFKQYRGSAYSGLPVIHNEVLGHHQEKVYLQRMMQLKQSIKNNKALQGFSFVAPVPTDLAVLSLDNYAALHAFLKDITKAYQVSHIEQVHPYTLALQIKGIPQGNIELWIDVPTRNVYLMSDNVYTTADGKYGLHF